MGSFAAEAQARVAARVKLPEGYTLTWGGEFSNQKRAMARLQINRATFRTLDISRCCTWPSRARFRRFVVLLNIPFAVVGGVLALYLTHTELSVSSAVRLSLRLFGVSVMNGVLIITYMRRASARAGASHDTILDAVSSRIRPVLMTRYLPSLGLLPAALSHAIGSDTQRPFAIVIVVA